MNQIIQFCQNMNKIIKRRNKMIVKYGKEKTQFGTGVDIILTGNEVATAIDSYLVSHNIHVDGARTITVNNELCKEGRIYVDPSGFVISKGKKFSGRGKN